MAPTTAQLRCRTIALSRSVRMGFHPRAEHGELMTPFRMGKTLKTSALQNSWVRRYQKGPHHAVPLANFEAITQPHRTLFDSLIQGEPIDLYVYNADSGDLLFGRANLQNNYPRDLAHHIGLVRRYLRLIPGPAENKFSQGSMDIAVSHSNKEVYFKHLTLGLQDVVFPEELEWMTHIDSLQQLAMEALREIGMPGSYKKAVLKASEWARIRTGLMQGKEITYEEWKARLKKGKL